MPGSSQPMSHLPWWALIGAVNPFFMSQFVSVFWQQHTSRLQIIVASRFASLSFLYFSLFPTYLGFSLSWLQGHSANAHTVSGKGSIWVSFYSPEHSLFLLKLIFVKPNVTPQMNHSELNYLEFVTSAVQLLYSLYSFLKKYPVLNIIFS